MNWGDVQYGQQQGTKNERSARAADNHAWQDFANNLESKLNKAQSAETYEYVERKVAVTYVHALREALAKVAPNHPMLREDVATRLFDEARTKAYAERGYSYDVKTGTKKKA